MTYILLVLLARFQLENWSAPARLDLAWNFHSSGLLEPENSSSNSSLVVKSQLTATCSQNPKNVLTNWKFYNPNDSNSKWRQPHYVRKGVTNASRVNEVTLLLLLLCTTVFLIKSKNSFFSFLLWDLTQTKFFLTFPVGL